MDKRALIEAETELTSPLLCPELLLHLITERCRLWRAGERELAEIGLPEPYWAFAWPGGQALARYVLDRPALVRGKSVLDFGTGSGIAGIAAAKSGARVLASDIDPFALEAASLNALANEVELETTARDLIGEEGAWDVVLGADMSYEAAMTARILPWYHRLAASSTLVLLADPGRGFLKSESLREVAVYDAPADVDTDGRIRRRTSILRV